MATLSQRELDTLVRITYDESGAEPPMGQMGVLWVLRNRVKNVGGNWANTIEGVVTQYGQFEPARGSGPMGSESIDKLTPLSQIPAAQREQLAAMAQAVWSADQSQDITAGANHFLNLATQRQRGHIPDWVERIARANGGMDEIYRHTFIGGDPALARARRAEMDDSTFASLLASGRSSAMMLEVANQGYGLFNAYLKSPSELNSVAGVESSVVFDSEATGLKAMGQQAALDRLAGGLPAAHRPEGALVGDMEAFMAERGVLAADDPTRAELEGLEGDARAAELKELGLIETDIDRDGDPDLVNPEAANFGPQSVAVLDKLTEAYAAFRAEDPQAFAQMIERHNEQHAQSERFRREEQQRRLDQAVASGRDGFNPDDFLMLLVLAVFNPDGAQEQIDAMLGIGVGDDAPGRGGGGYSLVNSNPYIMPASYSSAMHAYSDGIVVEDGQMVLTMPVDGETSSAFGPRDLYDNGKVRMHNGVDFAAPVGTPIYPAAPGVVEKVFDQGNQGYGKVIYIRHEDGSQTRYAHNNANLVHVGQRVDMDTVIGTVGNTGHSTGPHLHFEHRVLRDGKLVAVQPQFAGYQHLDLFRTSASDTFDRVNVTRAASATALAEMVAEQELQRAAALASARKAGDNLPATRDGTGGRGEGTAIQADHYRGVEPRVVSALEASRGELAAMGIATLARVHGTGTSSFYRPNGTTTHGDGLAADLHTSHLTAAEKYHLIQTLVKHGANGIGFYTDAGNVPSGSLHADWRNQSSVALWGHLQRTSGVSKRSNYPDFVGHAIDDGLRARRGLGPLHTHKYQLQSPGTLLAGQGQDALTGAAGDDTLSGAQRRDYLREAAVAAAGLTSTGVQGPETTPKTNSVAGGLNVQEAAAKSLTASGVTGPVANDNPTLSDVTPKTAAGELAGKTEAATTVAAAPTNAATTPPPDAHDPRKAVRT